MLSRVAVVAALALLLAACGHSPVAPTPIASVLPAASHSLDSGTAVFALPFSVQTVLPADGTVCYFVPVGIAIRQNGWTVVDAGPDRLTARLAWSASAILYLSVSTTPFTVPVVPGLRDYHFGRVTGPGHADISWPSPTGQYFVCINQYGGSPQPYTLTIEPTALLRAELGRQGPHGRF